MITTEEGFKRIQGQLDQARLELKGKAISPTEKARVNQRIDRLLDEYLQLAARSAIEVPSN